MLLQSKSLSKCFLFLYRLCKKKQSGGRRGSEANTVGFLDIEDEIVEEIYEEVTLEEQEEEDSDSLEDYETDTEGNGDITDGVLKVNCAPTNGSVVIIKDLTSWLNCPYLEI